MSDRTERVVTMTRCSDEPLHTGDRLDLQRDATSGRIVVMRHYRVIGVLPEWLSLDTETWAAKSADGKDGVRLLPFTIEDCGCCLNLGSYIVRRCERHQQEFDAEPDDKADYEGFGDDGWTDDPRREQNAVYREIT